MDQISSKSQSNLLTKVLLTGCTGFVASHILRMLLE